MRRRLIVIGGVVLLLAIGLSVLGRWEGRRAVDRELRDMRAILAVAGPSLDRRTPFAYRPAERFACLLYQTAEAEPFGLELCFASDGMLIETIDRRGGVVRVASVREQPEASDIRVDVSTILAALRRASPRQFGADVTVLPVGVPDGGPIVLSSAKPAAAP